MTLQEVLLFTPHSVMVCILALPLLSALVSSVISWANLRDIINTILGIVLFVSVGNLTFHTFNMIIPPLVVFTPVSEVSFSLVTEPLGLLFALLASFLWVMTNIYSIGYMRGNRERAQNKFFACFGLAIFATMGIALSQNLLTLFLFYEILTLSTYPLVTHHGTSEAKQAGRTYLTLLLGTSVLFFLPAIIWTWIITGTTDFTPGGILSSQPSPVTTGLLLLLYTYGIGKSALMPLHRWLPSAMVAPVPVSALLHAVAVVKTGVFTLMKVIIYIFGVNYLTDISLENFWAGGWLIYIACFTMLLASIVALKQEQLKLLLAYSTISQLAYIILTAALFIPLSITAAAFYLVAHAIAKITLFFAAGAIYTASKKKTVAEMAGVAKRMPWTMAAFTIGAFSIIGIPPTLGFLSKYMLLLAVFQTQQAWIAIAIVVSTLLSAAYYLPIIYAAYFKKEALAAKAHGEASLLCVIPLTITALLTLVLFFFPNTIGDLTLALTSSLESANAN